MDYQEITNFIGFSQEHVTCEKCHKKFRAVAKYRQLEKDIRKRNVDMINTPHWWLMITSAIPRVLDNGDIIKNKNGTYSKEIGHICTPTVWTASNTVSRECCPDPYHKEYNCCNEVKYYETFVNHHSTLTQQHVTCENCHETFREVEKHRQTPHWCKVIEWSIPNVLNNGYIVKNKTGTYSKEIGHICTPTVWTEFASTSRKNYPDLNDYIS